MKKVITWLIIFGIIIFIFVFIKNKQQSEKVINANIDFLCYQQNNRLTPQQMIEDKISRDSVKD